jgi:hypothetical protein
VSKTKQAVYHHNSFIQKRVAQAFYAWRAWTQSRYEKKNRVEDLKAILLQAKMVRMFHAWKRYADKKVSLTQLSQTIAQLKVQRIFRMWQSTAEVNATQRSKAVTLHNRHILVSCFKAWKMFGIRQRNLKTMMAKNTLDIERAAWNRWMKKAVKKLKIRQVVRHIMGGKIHRSFAAWRSRIFIMTNKDDNSRIYHK